MSEARLKIGERAFRVACEDGQESLLQNAAAILDKNAKSLLNSGQELSESQLLLMSGLMVADQLKATENENLNLQNYHKDLESRLSKVELTAKGAASKAREESKSELNAAKEALALAQKEQKEAEESLFELTKKLQASEENAQRIKKELEEAKSLASSEDLEKLQKEAEEAEGLKSQIVNLQSDLETANSSIAELKSQNQKLSETENEAAGLRTEIEELKKLNENKANVSSEELATLKEENEDLKSKLEFFMVGAPVADANHPESDGEDETQEKFEELEQQKRTLLAQLEESKVELQALRAQLSAENTSDPKSQEEKSEKQSSDNDLMSDLISGLEKIANS